MKTLKSLFTFCLLSAISFFSNDLNAQCACGNPSCPNYQKALKMYQNPSAPDMYNYQNPTMQTTPGFPSQNPKSQNMPNSMNSGYMWEGPNTQSGQTYEYPMGSEGFDPYDPYTNPYSNSPMQNDPFIYDENGIPQLPPALGDNSESFIPDNHPSKNQPMNNGMNYPSGNGIKYQNYNY